MHATKSAIDIAEDLFDELATSIEQYGIEVKSVSAGSDAKGFRIPDLLTPGTYTIIVHENGTVVSVNDWTDTTVTVAEAEAGDNGKRQDVETSNMDGLREALGEYELSAYRWQVRMSSGV